MDTELYDMKEGSCMICKNCGREIPDTSKFCFGCGAVINAAAQPEAPETPAGFSGSYAEPQPPHVPPAENSVQYAPPAGAQDHPAQQEQAPAYYAQPAHAQPPYYAQPGGNAPAGGAEPGSGSPQAGYPQNAAYNGDTVHLSYEDASSGSASNAAGSFEQNPASSPVQSAQASQAFQVPQAAQPLQPGAYTYYAQPSPAGTAVKKSKKGLIIGLSVGGGVLLILIVVLILVFSGVFKGSGNIPSLVYDENTITYGMPYEDVEDMVSDIYLYDEDTTLAFSEEMGNTTLLVRDEETVVGWYIQDRGTELSSGLKVGDRFSKMEELYPDAEYTGSGSFDPDSDYAGEFIVYYDPSGNICTEDQYEDYVDDADGDEELAALRIMVIAIENGRVLDIILSDELMYSYME